MSQSDIPALPAKAPGDRPRRIGDVWQRLGLDGGFFGTAGRSRRGFRYAYAMAALIVGVINTLNVMSAAHDMPHLSVLEPLIWEGSSWLSLMAFFWIVWLAWRLAPFQVRPRWLLLIHIPAALVFSLAHVSGFVALRILAYRALGGHYHVGHFWAGFFYELRKDSFGYVMFLLGFALIGHLLRQQQVIQSPAQNLTFDIRDGAKLTRVKLSDILAITSAGNYVEFALADGRRLLMRSPLSALENDLSGRGFIRTHRSWLVNEAAVTGLTPEGSGDYGVVLGSLTAPLSRRFPAALARLRRENSA
ncbi:MAG TPA: LytTR family DNA-binding domain-containing protein [Rhizomicrobium sp.]|nr:LytTR family DNA-binding domain-containing protein [Rhizomicrobium sp.]